MVMKVLEGPHSDRKALVSISGKVSQKGEYEDQ